MKENSIGAVFNKKNDNKWTHYQIRKGKAVTISLKLFNSLLKSEHVNMPLYATDEEALCYMVKEK
jgi:hypothetical protein